MVKIRMYVERGKKGKTELTNGPVPMSMINSLSSIVLFSTPETRALGVSVIPLSKEAQYLVHPGDTLSFEVTE